MYLQKELGVVGDWGGWNVEEGKKKKGFRAGGKGVKEMRSVQESWRVVEYLHAQSLFTLHQTAGTATEDTASGWHSVSTFTCWKALLGADWRCLFHSSSPSQNS